MILKVEEININNVTGNGRKQATENFALTDETS